VLDPHPEQTAAILFTSGSTGVPKGVVTPFRVFAAQVEALRTVYGIEPGESDLATFPLFALFGPALGMASIVPDMDASRPGATDPERLLEALHDFACTNLFASPALIDKLGRHCADHHLTLSSLRRAISAGAPASAPALERFRTALPEGVEVLTSYGATEALPVSVMASEELLRDTRQITERGGGVCVGRPVPGMQVRIIAIHDQPVEAWSEDLPLAAGEIGEIVVCGAVVTPSYYKRPAATRLAKIPGADGGFWHRMGDVGYFDEHGRLWMCGRKGHRVETDRGTLFTIPCEAVFNTHPAVRRSALVGVTRSSGRPGRTQPVLCVERAPGHDVRPAALTQELLEIAKQHDHTRSIETVLYHDAFPVDVRHNAKIFREKLATWAQEQLP
jgi:acyl-CoA synthetase (AMP-forming)/AMP-acid ligase II